jgi:hypothetical protein
MPQKRTLFCAHTGLYQPLCLRERFRLRIISLVFAGDHYFNKAGENIWASSPSSFQVRRFWSQECPDEFRASSSVSYSKL